MSRPRESNHATRNHSGGHRSGNHWEVEGDRSALDQDLKKAQRTYAQGAEVLGVDAQGAGLQAKPDQGFRKVEDGTPVTYRPGRVVYEPPDQSKEDFELRQQIRDTGILAPKAPKSMLNYTVDERDVQYIKEREKAKLEQAWHAYCLSHWDPRTPEGKRILKKQAPELLSRMVETMKSEHELSMRMQEIDMLGIDENRPGDLQLLFLMDNQALTDLNKQREKSQYIPGYFMPRLQPEPIKARHLWEERAQGADRLKGPQAYNVGGGTSLGVQPKYKMPPLTEWLRGNWLQTEKTNPNVNVSLSTAGPFK